MKAIILSRSKFKAIQKLANESAERNGAETCGLLIDNGLCVDLVTVRNKTKQGGGFSFYVQDIRNLQKAVDALQYEIVGTFHSHPVGLAKPGQSDLNNAVDDSLMLIFDVLGNSAKLWHIKERTAQPVPYRLSKH